MAVADPHLSAPLVRSFSTLEEASAAQSALLASGLAPGAAELRVIDDEAGPVEGNFVSGNGRTTDGGPPRGMRTGPQVPYEDNFQKTVRRGAFLLIVSAQQDQVDAVRAVLDRFEGVDVDESTKEA
ncbi:MAG TPA: hypothetical protein VEA40_17285 [Ramlibacter sp.]|nr:hypothetical protein [Ramlibacter sp.]